MSYEARAGLELSKEKLHQSLETPLRDTNVSTGRPELARVLALQSIAGSLAVLAECALSAKLRATGV